MFSSMHLCIPLRVGLFHIKNVSPLGQRPHPLSCIPQCVPHALSWDGLSRSLPHTHGLHSVAWCSPRTKEGGRGWSWAGRAMGLQEHECCAVAVDGSLPKAFFILFFVLQLFAILVAKKQSKAASFFLSHHLKIWSRSSGKQRPRRKLPVEMDSSSTPQDVCPAPWSPCSPQLGIVRMYFCQDTFRPWQSLPPKFSRSVLPKR